MAELQRAVKDNVFCNMFNRREYTIQLYRALHPEDASTVESDIKNCTINSVQSADIYNDLGFLVNNRLIVLVEAQTTWSDNVPLRSMFYLTYSYLDYIKDTDLDLYGTAKVQIPKPELYMIYTKDKSGHPDMLSLRRDFFNGDCCVDAQVKVLYLDGSKNIIDQYINYCRVYDEQTKLYGYTKEALKEIFRICIENGYLTEYLTEHRQEVMTMMEVLFDQTRQDRIRENAILARGEARGIGIGEARGSFNTYTSLVNDGAISKEYAAGKLGITVAEFDKRAAENCRNL